MKKYLSKYVLGICLLLMPLTMQARSLYWDQIEVFAHLNADGSLDIREVQDYVFNGEWNGGERWFDLGAGQKLNFKSIERFQDGRWIPLKKGSLDDVNDFKWVESNKIRWRSRLASDPDFVHQSLKYALAFRYDWILKKSGEEFLIDHNFLFSDRSGEVRKFILHFDADPVWQIPYELPMKVSADLLQPGYGYVLKFKMKHAFPAQVHALEPISNDLRRMLMLCALSIVFILWISFIKKETQKGRFKKVPDFRNFVTDKMLQEKVFNLQPEEVGALWDEKIGAEEVSALLARLVQEEKLKSTVIKDPNSFWGNRALMELELLVPRTAFKGYEKKLIDGLFFGNRKKINTRELGNHYRNTSSGFDPAAEISPDLSLSMMNHTDLHSHALPSSAYRWSMRSLGLGVLILGLLYLFRGFGYIQQGFLSSLFALLAFTVALIPCVLIAKDKIAQPLLIPLQVLCGALMPLLGFYWGVAAVPEGVFLVPYLASVLVAIVFSRILLLLAQTDNPPKKIIFRRTLMAIRNYFKNELKQSEPKLKDEWFPYLLAFGLAPAIDEWTKSYSKNARSLYASSSDASAGSNNSSTWTGGGGKFGGAGATGTWIAASGAMAASISPPSSSSSGSGGGGSSGGGGGGGW